MNILPDADTYTSTSTSKKVVNMIWVSSTAPSSFRVFRVQTLFGARFYSYNGNNGGGGGQCNLDLAWNREILNPPIMYELEPLPYGRCS